MMAIWKAATESERKQVEAEAGAGDVMAKAVLDALEWESGTRAAEIVTKALQKDGAVVVRATVYDNQPVVFVRDRKVKAHPAWSDYPIFDMDELRKLAKTTWTPEGIRLILESKKVLRTRVVDVRKREATEE